MRQGAAVSPSCTRGVAQGGSKNFWNQIDRTGIWRVRSLGLGDSGAWSTDSASSKSPPALGSRQEKLVLPPLGTGRPNESL